jgi:transcriptional regulator with XRE-family HTH domain
METPSLFDHGKIPTRKELRARLQEIKELLPRAGAVARRLREKRKMSERDLAKAVGVMPRDIMRLEREGLVRVLVDPRLRGYGSIADPEQLPRDNSKLERFLEILEPNLHERAVLLQDISGELHDELIAVAIELMDEGYGIDFTWPDTKRTVFADPWQEEDKPRPSKRQRAPVPAISAARAAGSSASSSSCGSHPVGGSRQVGTEGADAAPLQRPVPVNVRAVTTVSSASAW